MRKHLLNVLGLVLSLGFGLFLVLFSIWQLDLICVSPVWSQSWSTATQYASHPWECWVWHSTVGEAYNDLFAFIAVGFFVTFFGTFISLWTWDD